MPTDHSVLVAYIHQRAGVPSAGTALLRDFIIEHAEREGLRLDSVFVAQDGQEDRFTVQDLVNHVHACGASSVLVAGPAHTAIRALRALTGVKVLTLEDTLPRDVRPIVQPSWPGRGWASDPMN